MSNYKSDEILDRLTKILNLLNQNKALSIKELCNEMGTDISGKTLERDLTERLISFPIELKEMKWRLQDSFRFKDYKSIEDAVVLDMLEKMMKSGGPNFFSKGKKFFNTSNSFDSACDSEDIADQPKEVQKIENSKKYFGKYPALEKIIDTNDGMLESEEEIKNYLEEFHVGYLKHVHGFRSALGVLKNNKYVIIGNNDIYEYNSVKEIVENGLRVSLEPLITNIS